MNDQEHVKSFQRILKPYYAEKRREMSWRSPEVDGVFDPYKILVSEIMLQQTQVVRVEKYYDLFLARFPTIYKLASADLIDVLKIWQGLGYSRRAKFLRDASRVVVDEYDGIMPKTEEQLTKLPGVGNNTAGAIMAYAYNQPALFVETNIRTVYIHHFFADSTPVSDSDILNILRLTMNWTSPRQFYWALMDYGSELKAMRSKAHVRSERYVKQTKFEGSKRQLRAKVLTIISSGPISRGSLDVKVDDNRLDSVVNDLLKEKMISEQKGKLYIAS